MKLTEHDNGNRYTVKSDSGNTYTVKYAGCDPDEYDENIRLWECDCPAGSFGKTCKHIKAISVFIADQVEGELGS